MINKIPILQKGMKMKICTLCNNKNLSTETMYDDAGVECYYNKCSDCGCEYIDLELLLRNNNNRAECFKYS